MARPPAEHLTRDGKSTSPFWSYVLAAGACAFLTRLRSRGTRCRATPRSAKRPLSGIPTPAEAEQSVALPFCIHLCYRQKCQNVLRKVLEGVRSGLASTVKSMEDHDLPAGQEAVHFVFSVAVSKKRFAVLRRRRSASWTGTGRRTHNGSTLRSLPSPR